MARRPRHVGALALLAGVCLVTERSSPAEPDAPGPPLARIAFGSCVHQCSAQPIWDAVLAADPDLFLLLGDNVYADTTDMEALRSAYADLAASAGYQALRRACPLLATWDDHDYGRDDAGADYAERIGSQRVFLDSFGEPADSPRRRREGVYDARIFGPEGGRVQVILLDTRYHRSLLRSTVADGLKAYVANEDPAATMLGPAQWAWLEQELRRPAELRLVVSSIQFVAEEQRFEKWSNLPRERRRLLDLIAKTRASGVIVLSGDRHHAELSRLEGGPYSLYDLTSSSLNITRKPDEEPNRHRLGDAVFADNFGLVAIDWTEDDPAITLSIVDETGSVHLERRLRLSELRPRDARR